MLGTVLIPRQYIIESAPDAIKAWEIIHQFKPHLVILDIMMPGMSGIDFCAKLRQDAELKNTLVIMLSAKDSQSDRLQGLQYGADDYVTKPFHVATLVNKIDHMLSRD